MREKSANPLDYVYFNTVFNTPFSDALRQVVESLKSFVKSGVYAPRTPPGLTSPLGTATRPA